MARKPPPAWLIAEAQTIRCWDCNSQTEIRKVPIEQSGCHDRNGPLPFRVVVLHDKTCPFHNQKLKEAQDAE